MKTMQRKQVMFQKKRNTYGVHTKNSLNYMLQLSEFHIISSRVLRLNPISNIPYLHSYLNA